MLKASFFALFHPSHCSLNRVRQAQRQRQFCRVVSVERGGCNSDGHIQILEISASEGTDVNAGDCLMRGHFRDQLWGLSAHPAKVLTCLPVAI